MQSSSLRCWTQIDQGSGQLTEGRGLIGFGFGGGGLLAEASWPAYVVRLKHVALQRLECLGPIHAERN